LSVSEHTGSDRHDRGPIPSVTSSLLVCLWREFKRQTSRGESNARTPYVFHVSSIKAYGDQRYGGTTKKVNYFSR